MRSFSFVLLICSLLVLVSSVTALHPANLAKRQDSDGTESQPTRTTNTADSTDTSEATETGTADITETGTETGTQTRSTGTRTTKSRVTSVDPRSPPGGIKMITPAPTDGTTYIKVGDLATFSWNYTSVKVTPTAVDVVAFCNKNQYYYTMAGNQTYKETGGVTWDTSTHETDQPLLTEIYTLLVYDVDIGPSDLPPPGRLGAQRNFKFGVYHPQEYTPLSKSECVTCLNGGAITDARQALFFMFGMVAITVCSFGWFASGFGLFA